MKRHVAGLALALLILGGCATSEEAEDDQQTEQSTPDPNDPDVVGDRYGAQAVCRQFVEERLKSPSTAEFNDEKATQIRGPVWKVVGAVDAENSFGAALRSTFTCRVKFTGDDNWRLQRLTGLD